MSTIEAITHSAKAAGLSEEDCHSLLFLFRLQKFRVFKRVDDGGRPPRAINVRFVMECYKIYKYFNCNLFNL